MNDKAKDIAGEIICYAVYEDDDGIIKIDHEKAAALIRPHLREWTSVKDRLPEPYTKWLVCNAMGTTGDDREPYIAHMEKNKWWVFQDKWHEAKPTHWRELPEAP